MRATSCDSAGGTAKEARDPANQAILPLRGKPINALTASNTKVFENKEVQELIEYTQELEGQLLERKIEDSYDKEHMLKSMLSDILSSCREYEENKILEDRYPDLYEKVDADSLVKNLKDYILDMNFMNNLGL